MRGWDVVGIVTVRTGLGGSMMFQGVGTAIAGLQSSSASIPWLPVRQIEEDGVESLERALLPIVEGTNWPKTTIWSESELMEAEWPRGWKWNDNLVRLRSGRPIDGIVSGALRSDYQRTRLDRMAERLGITSFSPLWHHDSQEHMLALIKHGFVMVITSVSAEGMSERWVGRTVDEEAIEELVELRSINGMNMDGEGGEYETTVLDAPWMRSRIVIQGNSVWEGSRGHYAIGTATLC